MNSLTCSSPASTTNPSVVAPQIQRSALPKNNRARFKAGSKSRAECLARAWLLVLVSFVAGTCNTPASDPPPLGSGDPLWLNAWTFSDTNHWVSSRGGAPLSFTNLAVSDLGKGSAVVLDDPEEAWLQYRILETDGTTNLSLAQGSLLFWFAPNWSSTNLEGGTGPQSWSPLLTVGRYTEDASYGWWSLYLDPDGANLYFSSQTNDSTEATYLAAPIVWETNRWHLVALTYSSTNSALYLDGYLAAEGPGVSCWPGAEVLTNGFYLGSDASGLYQAHGMFDDLETYNYALVPEVIADIFSYDYMIYYGCPMNMANFSSAPSVPAYAPTFVAMAGPGFLKPKSTNTAGCVTSNKVWLTNVFGTRTNGAMSLTFTIAGGSNGVPYDLFANSMIGWTNVGLYPWGWMGQGYRCVTYTLTDLTNAAVFLCLGTPLDSDQDGLTDAYERLVSHTDPHKADTSGDGMLDGWKVVWGLNLQAINTLDVNRRSNYGYNTVGWINEVSGIRIGVISLDSEGNVISVSQ